MTRASLAGVRVALTRDAAQCEHSAREVLEQGGVPCVFPLLQIAPVADHGELCAALQSLVAGDVVAFTSVNGVVFSMGEARAALRDASARSVHFAAVGELTAAALRAEHLAERPLVPATNQTGTALAEALLQQTATKAKVLVLGAEQSRPELADMLRSAGRTVQTLAVYRTLLGDASALWAAVEAGEIDALVFASPTAVRAFACGRALERLPERVQVACIGETTRGEACALGLRVDVVPEHPSMHALLVALAGTLRLP